MQTKVFFSGLISCYVSIRRQTKEVIANTSIDRQPGVQITGNYTSILVSFYSDIEYRTNFVISYEDKKVERNYYIIY